MKIHKDGWGTIITTWVICACIALATVIFFDSKWIVTPVCMFMVALMVFVIFFFRVPARRGDNTEDAITSVADGEVAIIEKVYEDEYLKKDCIQISVYMDFFNVHVNFWPVSGEVTYYKYHPGKYLLAWMPKASELNEHSSIAVRTKYGEILFRQIAGTFARRLVTYAKVGDKVTKGTQCGLIKFGSRIDMFIPADSFIEAELGEDVLASVSVLAKFASKA